MYYLTIMLFYFALLFIILNSFILIKWLSNKSTKTQQQEPQPVPIQEQPVPIQEQPVPIQEQHAPIQQPPQADPAGALLQLVAFGAQNAHIPRHISKTFNKSRFDLIDGKYKNEIQRLGDLVKPRYIQFNLNNDVSVKDFIETNKDKVLELIIGGQTLSANTIGLLSKLNEPVKINNSILLKIPFELFATNINLLAIQFFTVKYELNINDVNINRIELISDYTYLDNPERADMANNPREEFIQTIDSHYITRPNPSTEMNIRLNFNNISKGYLIEGDINNLEYINMKINGHNRLQYDKIYFQLFCHRINENLLYIPLNTDYKLEDKTPDSFIGGINQSRIDNLIMKLTFSNNQTKIGIHSVTANKLRYANGLMGTQFAPNQIVFDDGNFVPPPVAGFNFLLPGPITPITWKYLYKLINLTKNDECPIVYDKFTNGCKYSTCMQCTYNFSEEGILDWFKISRKCPMCKVEWKKFEMYVNEESEDDIFVDYDNVNFIEA